MSNTLIETNGYDDYRLSLSQPFPNNNNDEFDEISSDDLSSDWESDSVQTVLAPPRKISAWRKVRNIVHWSPFVQTYKKQKYLWVQLAGHQGEFKSGEQGTVLKKLCGEEEFCYQKLFNDIIRPFVPKFRGRIIRDDGEVYLEMEDLLAGFIKPSVMDIKMGVRTYLEDELAKAHDKPKWRKDMYDKMVQIDPDEPTDEERRLKAVPKPRYMTWRETISSTSKLGFRIEGIKFNDGSMSKDFKTTKHEVDILSQFSKFINNHSHIVSISERDFGVSESQILRTFLDYLLLIKFMKARSAQLRLEKVKYLERLRNLRDTLRHSTFFNDHELIGSSLLFVHDERDANVWMIDFAKTYPLPNGIKISHNRQWQIGNHEDGYLIGLNNLIYLFDKLSDKRYQENITPSTQISDEKEMK